MNGKRFGLLVVLSEAPRLDKGPRRWLCRCDCGTESIKRQNNLLNRNTTSCGCYGKQFHKKHGMSGRQQYVTWRGMLDRCQNQNHPSFHRYGGRGISVCSKWQKFSGFYADMGDRPSAGHSLDRINNDGNYEPGNVTWATRLEQQQKLRHCLLIEHNGKTLSASAWSRATGISAKTISNRYHRGIRGASLFSKPLTIKEVYTQRTEIYTCFGKSQSLQAWSAQTGIKDATIRQRLRKGWPLDEALTRKPSPLPRR